MKSASLYRRGDKIIIHPWSKTTTGILVGTEPFIALRCGGSFEELGEAILLALDSAQVGLPHPNPSDWPAFDRPLLGAAGVRSWSSFVKGAVGVLILGKDAELQFVPQRNLGFREGFQDAGLERIEIPVRSDCKAIGEAAVRALDRSE